MPESSPEFEPADRGDFLQPADKATEVALLTDEEFERELREGAAIEQPDAYVRSKLGVGFWITTSWLVVIILLALLAPVLPFVQDYAKIAARPYQSPSADHWLGTDSLGRDMFARIVWGARVSLMVGFASIVLGGIIGVLIGVVAGYFRKSYDTTLMALMDVILAFPPLLLALSIVTFRDDRSVTNIVLAIGIVAIPAVARLVRANTLTFREREFVLASRNLGASHFRILAREILPNVLPAVVAYAVIGIAIAITAEAGLAYLGASVNPPQPTWGGMIAQAKPQLETHPEQVWIPCAVLTITVLCLYFSGDRLRRFFDVKESML